MVLRGVCHRDGCPFRHDVTLSSLDAAQRAALIYAARLYPCKDRQLCEVENCIFGHHVSHA
jgi:hypothetical protein